MFSNKLKCIEKFKIQSKTNRKWNLKASKTNKKLIITGNLKGIINIKFYTSFNALANYFFIVILWYLDLL